MKILSLILLLILGNCNPGGLPDPKDAYAECRTAAVSLLAIAINILNNPMSSEEKRNEASQSLNQGLLILYSCKKSYEDAKDE